MRIRSVAVERGVELGELLQHRHAGLEQQRDHRHLHVLLGVDLLAERLELGDVGLVVVGDVRDVDPVAGQVRAADPLDARELDALDLAVLRVVDARPRRHVEAPDRRPHRSVATPAVSPRSTSSTVIRPLRPVPSTRARSTPTLARQPAHRGARVDGSGSGAALPGAVAGPRRSLASCSPPLAASGSLSCSAAPLPPSGSSPSPSPCSVGASPPSPSISAIRVPSLTVSPTATSSFVDRPRLGSGDVHRRLVGLERDQALLGLDRRRPRRRGSRSPARR